ncbi:MAG: MerR family transcriptional regulator [Lachnospiraceae bacterium]|nr:MerR family transcriptional regulator [Lachnospiraceae bacterium]MDE7272687.1 MerR family transcriptional regulator [Lachnospiraceae bacterium]
MDNQYYTAGEIARIAGISLRTIRYYDTKGLLPPVSHSDTGYRYYDKGSLALLQRIMMLKYLGFSLEQIQQLIAAQEAHALDQEAILAQQKSLLLEKKKQLELLISTIELAQHSDQEDKWQVLVRCLNLLTSDEKVLEQYQNPENLKRRINIHNYSTSSQGWMEWVYERLNLQPGETVLELGCGTGLLWMDRIHLLPEGLNLVLTDRSAEMLEQTRQNLAPYEKELEVRRIHIAYRILDANTLELPPASYDRIIALHMLYHVERRDTCLASIARALKSKGTFYCSTVGDTHMQELHQLVIDFDPRIEMPIQNLTGGFHLENAAPQLTRHFAQVERQDQDNDLIVDDPQVIYDYIYSYPGNAPLILEQRGRELLAAIQDKLNREGAMFIHKSTGMFLCKK